MGESSQIAKRFGNLAYLIAAVSCAFSRGARAVQSRTPYQPLVEEDWTATCTSGWLTPALGEGARRRTRRGGLNGGLYIACSPLRRPFRMSSLRTTRQLALRHNGRLTPNLGDKAQRAELDEEGCTANSASRAHRSTLSSDDEPERTNGQMQKRTRRGEREKEGGVRRARLYLSYSKSLFAHH